MPATTRLDAARCASRRVERAGQRCRKLSNQRLSGDGEMVARYYMDWYLAFGQIAAAQRPIQWQVDSIGTLARNSVTGAGKTG